MKNKNTKQKDIYPPRLKYLLDSFKILLIPQVGEDSYLTKSENDK